jgi:hypothetical protein
MPGIKGPADKKMVEVNGRPMEVGLSAADPKNLEGDAYLSFFIDADVASATTALKRTNAEDQFVGIVVGPDSKQPIEDQISNATLSALKLMGENGAKSAVIPVSSLLAKRMGLSDIEMAASILKGANEYANHVREEASPDFVSEIAVAGGVSLFFRWMDGGPMIGKIVRTPPEEKESAIVLKSGTFDLSPSKLGSRIGITGFHGESAMSREPDELQRAWLEMIGEDIVSITDTRGFHRNSPFAPVMPNERKLIVTFDAGTGLPLSVQSGYDLPDPDRLASGEAAILVEYYEVGGRSHIALGREVVVSDRAADQEALRSIVGIAQFAPILPSANNDVLDLGDGTQLITPDGDVDELNAKFVHTVLNPKKYEPMTVMGLAFAFPKAWKTIAEYWSARTDKASTDDIYTFLSWRSLGHSQYDFYIDESGRFVGATMHQNWENSPRGTTYHVGSTTADKTGAIDVSFRTVKAEDGKTLKVPVSYEWRGKKALAFDAFQRWYNSIEFVRARNKIAIKDNLSEIMFPGMAPMDRAAKLIDYLEKHPKEMEIVDSEFYTVSGMDMNSHRQSYGAYKLSSSIKTAHPKGKRSIKATEFEIAFLELLMRRAMGEEKVDGILAAGITPSFGSAGNVPALPAGGGEKQGPEFLGIVREPIKGAPKAADDDESLHAAATEAEIAAYAQGSGSQVTTSAAIIISGSSVTGK